MTMQTYLPIKRAALDKMLQDLPGGARITGMYDSTFIEAGVRRRALRISWVDPRKKATDPDRKGGICYPFEDLAQHVEGMPEGGTITAIGGEYSYPLLPDVLAKAVPTGQKLVNVENYPEGGYTMLHCEGAGGLLSRIRVEGIHVKNPHLLRKFEGAYVAVTVTG